MPKNSLSRREALKPWIILITLYALELLVLVLALSINRWRGGSLVSFLSSRPGLFLLGTSSLFALSVVFVVYQYQQSRQIRYKTFAFTALTNLVTVAALVVTGEIAIRLFSFPTPDGLVFMNTALKPHAWEDVVSRNQEIIRKAATNGSYLVYDNLMGWSVGPNRRSANGLYFSSLEGIRSPRREMAFADFRAKYRVALIGDSFTFCEDVKYEDSWGYQLERILGSDFQVLNFGVSGYGVDQAYLRYYRDVRSWRPDFVIFGAFPHDFDRTMTVYSFVSFPGWEYPFSKPRFVLSGEDLKMLNVPALTPEAIFSKSSVTDLPFVEYDRGYNPADWQWRYYHKSFLFRFLISYYPLWHVPHGPVSDEMMESVNREILRAFVQLVSAEGSTPLVVYLPARREMGIAAANPGQKPNLAQNIIRSLGIPFLDLTPTLMELDAADRFVSANGHYSSQANAAIARRLRDVILTQLSDRQS